MLDFDELMAIGRIEVLMRERGQQPTDKQIRTAARRLANLRKMDLEDAYEHIEGTLLSDNPHPENWQP